MKRVIINESSYNRLLNESGYGNDDLDNLLDNLEIEFSDMNEAPNEYVSEIKKYADAISSILQEWRNSNNIQPEV